MVKMTSYFHHNFISIRETFFEDLVKIRHVDVKLRHMTSFSYIFPYYDVIDKNDDVSRKKWYFMIFLIRPYKGGS